MPGPSEYIADSRGADDESLCNDDTVSIIVISGALGYIVGTFSRSWPSVGIHREWLYQGN